MRTGQIPEHRPDGKHIVPVEPDAVTFTAMIMACAYRDDFEQSRALLLDMKQSAIESTPSVHNALINVRLARTRLPTSQSEEEPTAAAQSGDRPGGRPPQGDPAARAARGRGPRPDGYTYRPLRRCAGAMSAQRLLSRMLDTGVAPNELHFDALLRACARAQWIKRSDQWNDHLKAAASVPPSMVELGLEVSERARNSAQICAILRNSLRRHRAHRLS